jgi:hypothetical protein
VAWAQDHTFGMTEVEALSCCRAAPNTNAIELRDLDDRVKDQTSNVAYSGVFTCEPIGSRRSRAKRRVRAPQEVDLGGGFS